MPFLISKVYPEYDNLLIQFKYDSRFDGDLEWYMTNPQYVVQQIPPKPPKQPVVTEDKK